MGTIELGTPESTRLLAEIGARLAESDKRLKRLARETRREIKRLNEILADHDSRQDA